MRYRAGSLWKEILRLPDLPENYRSPNIPDTIGVRQFLQETGARAYQTRSEWLAEILPDAAGYARFRLIPTATVR